MTYYYYNTSTNGLTFTLKKETYYRFGKEESAGRFCFEFTWLSGTGRHFVGFTNSDKSRTFVVYYHQGGNPQLYTREPASHAPTSLNININTVGMVCIDTYISKITIIQGSESDSRVCTNVVDYGRWFAYLDYDMSSSSSCIVSINLGEYPYTNQMPEGYSPWIPTFSEEKCVTNKCFIISSFFILCGLSSVVILIS